MVTGADNSIILDIEGHSNVNTKYFVVVVGIHMKQKCLMNLLKFMWFDIIDNQIHVKMV